MNELAKIARVTERELGKPPKKPFWYSMPLPARTA
jgi:hypothetical protein